MKEDLIKILETEGPCTSTFLKNKLIKKGYSEESARKVISRLTAKRLDFELFNNKVKFLFLENQRNKVIFYNNLRKFLLRDKSSYAIALSSLIAQGGCLPEYLFHTFSGGTSVKAAKRISTFQILDKLKSVGLIVVEEHHEYGTLIIDRVTHSTTDYLAKMSAKLRIEEVVIAGIQSWLSKQGVVSYNTVQTRNKLESPKVGPFNWDICAPSYTFPIATYASKKIKPGFLVADVIFQNNLNEADLQYFINKFTTLHYCNTRAVCLLIVQHCELSTFRKCKGLGFILTTIENFFGKEVNDTLNQLALILTEAGLAVKSNPEQLTQLLNRISHVEGNYLNIRGDLFAIMVAYLKNKESHYVELNKSVTDPKSLNKAEVDIFSYNNHLISCIECKGIKNNKAVSHDEVEHWVTKQIPRIRNYILKQDNLSKMKIEFQLWTTGVLEKRSIEFLTNIADKTKIYKISWMERSVLLDYLKGKNENAAMHMIRTHY